LVIIKNLVLFKLALENVQGNILKREINKENLYLMKLARPLKKHMGTIKSVFVNLINSNGNVNLWMNLKNLNLREDITSGNETNDL